VERPQKGHRPTEDAHLLIINIHDEQQCVSIDRKSVELLVSLFFQWKKISTDEIDIHFVTKQRISKLHGDHFADPTPTDCITFPLDSPSDSSDDREKNDSSDKAQINVVPHHIGEVFICPEVARERHEFPLDEEISRYIIHTLLHLIGLRDDTDELREKMRQEEEKALEQLPKIKIIV